MQRFKKKIFIAASCLALLLSCTREKEHQYKPGEAAAVIYDPPQVVMLAELPDSAKPVTTALLPASRASHLQMSLSAQAVPLPALKNEKGEIIKDKNGNPFLFGEYGGMVHFTHYTTDQGLAMNRISSACTDHFGNLWFGTWGGGVSRYDGKSFTNYTMVHGLASNRVTSIAEDNAGNLWFGTWGEGVSRYDGKSFTNYTTAQGLADNTIWSIYKDKTGNLWFGTRAGVSCYNGKSFTNYTTMDGLAGNTVQAIAEDNAGNLWFGAYGEGVSRYDGKSFTNYTTAQGLGHNNVSSIVTDKSGDLWFGTLGGGVSRYDGKVFTNYTTAQGLAHNNVQSIAADRAGNLWFGTYGEGVSRYDGQTFTNYTTGQGLVHNMVRSIMADKTGNIWFGTYGGGLSRYSSLPLAHFTTAQGLAHSDVRSITEDKAGNLWFGTYSNGVSCYDGGTFTNWLTGKGIVGICEDKSGNLWFGADGGSLSCYDGKTFTRYTIPGWHILEDKAGNLWIGTLVNGVSCYDGKSLTNYTTAQGLAHNSVHSICEDKTGNIWLGTEGGGVSRYDGKSFTNYTTAQGLANNTVWTVMGDKAGNLWVGTAGGGISYYDGKSFTNFTTQDGLPSDVITQLLEISYPAVSGKQQEAQQAALAIGTISGIAILTGWKNKKDGVIIPFGKTPQGTLKNYAPVFEIYNSATGYPINTVNRGQSTIYQDSKGILWIGTGDDKTGLIRFDLASVSKNPYPPTVMLQGIKINGENICFYDLDRNCDSTIRAQQEVMTYGKLLDKEQRAALRKKFGDIKFNGIAKYYPVPEQLALPYHHNNISFDFNAIETGRHFLVRYRYTLEGYDKAWSPVTDKTSATFGNMREGVYTFRLKACSPDGLWSDPVTYTFRVLPPWWRTWWMYCLYALGMAGFIIFIVWWNNRRLLARNKVLEEKVQERTARLQTANEEIRKEKEKSESLLLNILPSEVAEELKEKGNAEAKQFDNVTVLFTDFVNFTQAGEKMTPQELVSELHHCFKAFDETISKYNIEKIKTIGDAYLAVCGLPNAVASETGAENIVQAALEIRKFMLFRKEQLGEKTFDVRIGIHSGSVVAGIVGVKKFAYDIWGDTVNTAARMEQNSEAGKINISETTYELVKDKFTCSYRGEIEAKNKGKLKMYFVENA